jgi:ATP phosphoribosyltransferase
MDLKSKKDGHEKLILAAPKGRILRELKPLLARTGIKPDPAFFLEESRGLRFTTNDKNLDIIRVRAFDVPTFVAYGGAHIGIAGSDVLDEFNYPEIYTPLNLNIGHCRLSVAMPESDAKNDNAAHQSHIRIATKYPNLTRRHYAARGIQAECIKLNGAMEIAPALGLATRIVDLVSTGKTLKANGLKETETILEVESYLITNRAATKTMPEAMNEWVEKFIKSIL